MIGMEKGRRKPTPPGLGRSHDLRHGDPIPEDWFRTSPLPLLQLRNGLRVANFSSGHPYIFEDSTKLEACTQERVAALALSPPTLDATAPGGRWTDVRVDLGAALPPQVLTELERLVSVRNEGTFDVLLVTRSMLDALGAQARGGAISAELKHMIVCGVRMPVLRNPTRNTYCLDRFAPP